MKGARYRVACIRDAFRPQLGRSHAEYEQHRKYDGQRTAYNGGSVSRSPPYRIRQPSRQQLTASGSFAIARCTSSHAGSFLPGPGVCCTRRIRCEAIRLIASLSPAPSDLRRIPCDIANHGYWYSRGLAPRSPRRFEPPVCLHTNIETNECMSPMLAQSGAGTERRHGTRSPSGRVMPANLKP